MSSVSAVNNRNLNNKQSHTLNIALIAIFSAMLTGGKLVLAMIPNIEIVTLIIALISVSLGLRISIPTILIFVTIQSQIYGFHYWVLCYYIYWPLLAVVFYLFNYNGLRHPLLNALLAGIMSALFGVITTTADAIVAGGLSNGIFLRLFGVFYARGIVFFALHIISNTIIILFLLKPMVLLINRITRNSRYYTLDRNNKEYQNYTNNTQ